MKVISFEELKNELEENKVDIYELVNVDVYFTDKESITNAMGTKGHSNHEVSIEIYGRNVKPKKRVVTIKIDSRDLEDYDLLNNDIVIDSINNSIITTNL